VVRGLLGQQHSSEGEESGPMPLTPEMIGVICFHRAQVRTVSLLCSCCNFQQLRKCEGYLVSNEDCEAAFAGGSGDFLAVWPLRTCRAGP
jgi:hypothetical protein